MQVQVNTDANIEGNAALLAHVEAEISAALARFDEQITRIEVHLSDDNGQRPGNTDKRCMLEARPAGQQPVVVTHNAETIDQACSGATQKLKHLLESSFGRLADRGGHATIRDGHSH
ncbi:Sigma 54 modulation protein / S30EA ribosomal protein [Amycolatopsis marina]|uniref:Sigma 54 modulation protein / S30EA ribosomal protein n=1 Tax=Amycolatopsis marina TaxID=490629 RepID=A0A1I1BXI3_9PSEU|nr:HPF/RaiA family ribosome-associated protein [Amycolatopsis marina]SFB54867.1 Sigma 54 modulation protein / S30EA ribosomal protein [Amycolatopsis marina]